MASTPEQLYDILNSVHEEVANKGDAFIFDRKTVPFFSFLMKQKIKKTFTQGKCVIKLQIDGGLDVEFTDGYGALGFQDNQVSSEMEFAPYRVHQGLNIWHADLEDDGYNIVGNAVRRGRNFANKMSKAEADRLFDLMEMKLEDADNSWIEKLDYNWHLDGSASPLNPVGLDGLMPVDNTSGNLGGQPRTDPLFQHYVDTTLTTAAAGNLDTRMDRAWRAVHLRNARGAKKTKVDVILAGADFMDGYKDFARNNGMDYNRNGGDMAIKRIDVGMPDSGVHYNGVPIVHDPTFEDLDSAGLGGGTPWTKRCYMLSSSTWGLGYQEGKLKEVSMPQDPAEYRVTRSSLYGRHMPYLTKASGNALLALA